MVCYKSIKKNRWKEKEIAKKRGNGFGWFGELSLAFVDAEKKYCVMVRKVQTEWGEVEHACFRNVENTDICWSEKQRIKNEIFGENATAVEVFPSTSNLVDEANMYHLWVLPNGFNLPFSLKEK